MRKNPIVAMLLTVIMLFAVVAPVMAYDPRPFINEVRDLRASGKMSNDVLHHAILDMSLSETQGTVSSVVYETVYENETHNRWTNITLQTPTVSADKLTRFVFELTNRYRPETDFFIAFSPDKLTVDTFVYGQYKDQAMLAYLSGIPDCLNNAPYVPPSQGGDGGDWIDNYSPSAIGTDPVTSFKVTSFEIDSTTYTVNDETKSMDVAPYIKNDRTYVPVRYLAYSLGVAEDAVTWDGNARKVGIAKGDTDISLIIGSPIMTVNKGPVTMDVSPEITSDRTFLPARWVAEALGAQVEWDDTAKQAIIKMPIAAEPGN